MQTHKKHAKMTKGIAVRGDNEVLHTENRDLIF